MFGGTTLIAAQPVDGDQSKRAPAQMVQSERRGNPLWEIPIKTLSATRDRPIFSPSRRPPPPIAVAAPYVPPRPPVKPASPQLNLVGTVLNATDGIGVFLDQTNNTVVRLKTGDYHNGWLLRSVQAREATLQNDRETVLLALPARGTERVGASSANNNTNVSAVQPVRELQGRVGPKFQLEKYD
jgi:general secretion pathway protein N